MFRVGLNKLETISQLVRTMSTDRVQEYLSSIPIVTKSLLLFNIAVHVVLFVTSFPVNDLAINPLVIIVHGEYYRMVSSAFVHGGLMHIVMNMSTLLAIGGSLENQYGTIPMLFLTLWCLLLCGATFVCMVWAYAIISSQPGELNTSAVGYSGVLFSYALIDAFHSVETSRSVFGMFSVPTKAYPFILLALIQVLMPNISFWGHLSGLVVGLLLISQIGVSLFMPTYDCMVYLEQMVPCCRPLVLCGGYVPVRDKDLVHAYLRCSTAGGGGGAGTGDCCSSCCAGIKSGLQAVAGAICYVCVFFWQILVFLLTMIGVPPAALRRAEDGCASLAACPRISLEYVLAPYSHVVAALRDNLCCCWGGSGGGSHAYTAVQTAEPLQDDDIEQQQQGGVTLLGTARATRSPIQQQPVISSVVGARPSAPAPAADIAATKGKSQGTATHYV